MPTEPDLTGRVELTLSSADATRPAVEALCAEARKHRYFAVCVNGAHVELAHALLEETEIKVVALVGFPLGAGDADVKRYETEVAIDHGAQEIDYVVNLGRLREGDDRFVLREMRDIVEAADERPVKAVLEMPLLTGEELVRVCRLAMDSGLKFLSTSTDFHTPPVKAEDIKRLRELFEGACGIKAVGGIRDAKLAREMIEAGADRVGMPIIKS